MTRHKRAVQSREIQPPHIERGGLAEITGPVTVVDCAAYTAIRLLRCQMGGQTAEDVVFEQVIGEHSDFSQMNLTRAQILDSHFQTCDFAGADFDRGYLRRDQIIECRLLGVMLMHADMEDLVVQKCNGEMSRFWGCTFRSVRFEQCILRQTSFENSTLAGVVFRNCDLTQADFRGASLRGADLRGSTLDSIQLGIKELQGVIIDSGQAVQLAMLLGMIVKDSTEDDSL